VLILRNGFMKHRSALIAAFAFAAATAGIALAEGTVALPSRLDGAAVMVPPSDDTSLMVEEWMSATGALPTYGAPSVSPHAGGVSRVFVYRDMSPAPIQCRVGMITDIELEPGERVENFAMTDGPKWSVSAAWSGSSENMTTHVLLRTNFPGLKSSLTVFTDRRNYSMDLSSSLGGVHMGRVAFKYLTELEDPEPYEKSIPKGKYRDLLEKYGLVEKLDAGRDDATPDPVDAVKLDFGYSIKETSADEGKKGGRAAWKPTSVYEAGGRTYFVMPKTKDGTPARPSLQVMRNGSWMNTRYKILENGLLVMEGTFDEAMMKLGGREITITRR
jgi:type IV secretion system protein VirB9